MAHLVEQMAYIGPTPWHGLGRQIESGLPIEDWIHHAGMAWNINETPVRFITGQHEHLGEIKTLPSKKVLYRSDTHEPLSVVGQSFKVVQPHEILEFYRDLTEQSGFELETAGVLKGGRKLWALAKTGQSTELKDHDITRGYVLLATACDGSMATTAQFTSIRVVCNNTLSVAMSDSEGAIKVPHRSTFNADAVKKRLGISVSSWDEFMYRMKLLSERRVSTQESLDFLQRVLIEPETQVLTRSNQRNLTTTFNLFEGRGMGANLSTARGTAYGLLNSVTQFVDYERRARNQDNRLDSAWFGQGSAIKGLALNEAMRMIA